MGKRDTIRCFEIFLGGMRRIFSRNRDILLSRIRTTYSLGSGTFPGKRDIVSSGKDLILWDPDHLSSGIRDILWIRDMGKGTRYPLGSGPLFVDPLGSCYLGDGFQPSKMPFPCKLYFENLTKLRTYVYLDSICQYSLFLNFHLRGTVKQMRYVYNYICFYAYKGKHNML